MGDGVSVGRGVFVGRGVLVIVGVSDGGGVGDVVKVAVAVFVGVGQVVAGGWRGAAQRRERPGIESEGITDVVEADGVGQLREEQRDDVTPRRKRAGFRIDLRVPG